MYRKYIYCSLYMFEVGVGHGYRWWGRNVVMEGVDVFYVERERVCVVQAYVKWKVWCVLVS